MRVRVSANGRERGQLTLFSVLELNLYERIFSLQVKVTNNLHCLRTRHYPKFIALRNLVFVSIFILISEFIDN